MKTNTFLKNLFKGKFVLLFIFIFTFFAGYFVGEGINYVNETYECNFTSTVTIVEDDVLSLDHLTNIRDSAEKYAEINVDSLKKNNEISLIKNEENYTITTYARCYENFFISKSETVSTRAKMYIKDLLLDMYGESITFALPNEIIETKNSVSELNIALITCGVCTLITIVALLLKPKEIDKNNESEDSIYDNETVFKTPFHLQFWKNSLHFVDSPKKITTLAMLFSIYLLSKAIVLPSGFGNLGLSFGFIFFSICCLTFGPCASVVIGFFGDIIGYFLFDKTGYPFAFCYVWQTVLAGVIYALMLNQTKITYFRVLITRLLIGFLCNVIVGSLCWGSVNNYTMSQTMSYMLLFELPKNIVYLIPQSIVLFIVYKPIIPILSKFGLIDKKIGNNITIL